MATYKKSFVHKILHFLTHQSKEMYLMWILGMLFGVILMRLFWVQVVKSFTFEEQLIKQHFTTQDIKADRGNIYVTNEAGQAIKLTESIDQYTVFVDPKYVKYKEKFIEILTPYIYQHYCVLRGTIAPSKIECIQGLESFTQTGILPPTKHQFFVVQEEPITYDSEGNIIDPGFVSGAIMSGINDPGISQSGISTFDEEEYNEYLLARQKTIDEFTHAQGLALITQRLDRIINPGFRNFNFIGFIENNELAQHLASNPVPYLTLERNFYLYTQPSMVGDIDNAVKETQILLTQYGISMSDARIRTLLTPQENRYVKLMDGVSSIIATSLINIKKEYQSNKDWFFVTTGNNNERIPLMHGLGFEQVSKRYYPYGEFMANVLGFVDDNGKALYGIEQYFDTELAGKDGKINGFGTPWVGEVASNELDIDPAEDGEDITLTINPTIQKEIEELIKGYNIEFRSDSISVMIMNPWNGEIVASANYPTFNPNTPNDVYQVKPLGPEERHLTLDVTYVDVPMYILSGSKLLPATSNQRFDLTIPKYIHRNINGPSVFIDKLIAYPYEPGSIFKPITTAIGLDVDEISLYDRYYDGGSLTIGPYEIKNVAKACIGTHDFLHALQYSCNVGMIRIIQRIRDYVFYNYLDRLGFGKLTGIELAGEEKGMIPDVSSVSRAAFYNNSFGQGLTTTPVQIAQAFSAIVNGGYLVEPTIVKKIGDITNNHSQQKRIKVFKDGVTEEMIDALYMVVNEGQIRQFALPGYSLGGKTGTSQIAYRGKYQQGAGWTNGSFAGILTKDNLKYVVVVQIRRPRASVRGELTAGKIYGDIAKFLIMYEGIEK